MNKQIMANHLGFYTWEQLIGASDLVSNDEARTWYVTATRTWYKWILWNTDGDVYFNNSTKEEALSTLKYIYEKNAIHNFVWHDGYDFSQFEPHMYGILDDSITWLELEM
ncbi:hypothetical protein [Alicyclobacillus ferrooxydans]|uniref:Uncharacterized protein n=1 Tax=Alicyclobacillus ferrooxydans TaxID=471514 RepID=A0A0P9C7G9_9BACL|nr:hypothetical protein [Alicyclobacillus ferrooxydans]KPV40870.1 hypothetical protein AN477_21535 [Alicyclobacillus ferrooxydans]